MNKSTEKRKRISFKYILIPRKIVFSNFRFNKVIRDFNKDAITNDLNTYISRLETGNQTINIVAIKKSFINDELIRYLNNYNQQTLVYKRRSSKYNLDFIETIVNNSIDNNNVKLLTHIYNQKYGSNKMSNTIMYNLLRNTLSYSYKRVYFKNKKKLTNENKHQTIVFIYNYSSILKHDIIIIAIDELYFSQANSKRMWSLKNEPKVLQNSGRVCSISAIAAIFPGGLLKFHINCNANDSNSFLAFIKSLMEDVRDHYCLAEAYQKGKICLLLDNARIHCSKELYKYANSISLKLIYLPPYTPRYSAIELFFSILKRDYYNRVFLYR